MRWLRKAGSGKRSEREAKTAEGYLHICGQWLQRAGMKAALCLCLFFLPSLFVQAQGRKAEELVVTYHYERYESGRIRLDQSDLICYNHGEYFGLEKQSLGRFGYSVMKPKTRKRLAAEQQKKRHPNTKQKRKKERSR